MMGKLEDKVRDQFKHWVEEDELDGIIDSELQKARSEVANQVRGLLQKKLSSRVEQWLKDWEDSEDAKTLAGEIGQGIVEGMKAFYFSKDYEEDDYGTNKKKKRCLYYSQDRWGDSPQRKVYAAVDKALAANVESVVTSWGRTEEAREMSNKVAESLIPKAAGAAIERLAIAFLQGRMHPKQGNVDQYGNSY